MDCEEIHDSLKCPVCASETFAYITRWVPTPEQPRPRPTSSPEADVYRALVSGEAMPSKGRQFLKQGAVALTALGVIGWLWQSRRRDGTDADPDGKGAAGRRETT